MVLNGADTCRRHIVPKFHAVGWDDEPHRINEQVTFSDMRIIVSGHQGRRRPGKREDYILRYHPDMSLGVVEDKFEHCMTPQNHNATEVDAILPSIIDKAFKEEL